MVKKRNKEKILITAVSVLCLIAAPAYAEGITHTDTKNGFSLIYPSKYNALQNYQGAALIIFFPRTRPELPQDYLSVTVAPAPKSATPAAELVEIYFKYDKTVDKMEKIKIGDVGFLSVTQTLQQRALWVTVKFKIYNLIAVMNDKVYTLTYYAMEKTFQDNFKEADAIMRSIKFTT